MSWSKFGATLAYFLSPCCSGGERGAIPRVPLLQDPAPVCEQHTSTQLRKSPTCCLPVDVRHTPHSASRLRGGDAVATGQLQARSACMTAHANGNMDATVATHDLNFSYPGIGACARRQWPSWTFADSQSEYGALPLLGRKRQGTWQVISCQWTGLSSSVPFLSFCMGADGRPMPGSTPVVQHMNIQLRPGQRCLLIGANGAGKTTLLKTLAGQHMVPEDSIRVLGRPPFHDTKLTASGDLSYLGGNWVRDIAFAGYSIPLQVLTSLSDAAVPTFAGFHTNTSRLHAQQHGSSLQGKAWQLVLRSPAGAGAGCSQAVSHNSPPILCTCCVGFMPACSTWMKGPSVTLRLCMLTPRIIQGDFPAAKMIDGLHGVDPARKARLLEVLDVDPTWRMHLVSDGQRRRVQLLLGLLHPFKVPP